MAQATFSWDGTTGRLTGGDRGSGTTFSVTPAAVRPLASPARKQAEQGQAFWTDALSQLTSYTLDYLGMRTQEVTPDGAVQTWTLDPGSTEQVDTYQDGLGRTTTFT